MTTERLLDFTNKTPLVPEDILYAGNSASAFAEVKATVQALISAYPNLLALGQLTLNANRILITNGSGDLVDSATTPAFTLGGAVDGNGQIISNLPDPTNDQEAATKAYVDAQASLGGSGGLRSVQVFTENGTWTKPAGIEQVLVQVVGGGGAGGSSLGGASVASAAGGGGGGFSQKLIDVTAISTVTVTIGAAGAPGAAGNNPGGDGGDTTFGAHCTAGGGGGGAGSANAAFSGGVAGVGGVGSGGDINSNGGPGGNGATRNGNANPGFGGSTFFGGGASSILSDAVGNAATSAGGGGGGSVSTSTSRQGGAGADGICIVYEYTVGASIPVGNVAPVGAIMSFARTTPPVGFLECDGSAISRTTYSELFTAIGTTWGVGDGSTTFNIPNLPRRTLVGSGGTGTAELGNAVGDTGGAETHLLTTAQMPSTSTTNATPSSINVVSNTGVASYVPQSGTPWAAGGNQAHNIIQPSAVVLMCIAYQANVVADATAASQAEMETATSNTVFSTPGRQQLHPGHPKAWVIYNQATGPSVVASYNVSSVTDNGAGIYTVNWDADFSDTNYSVLVSTIGAGSGNNAVTCSATAGTRSVGSQQFLTQQLTSALDRDGNCVAAFGDQ